jgi:hypothetical protein
MPPLVATAVKSLRRVVEVAEGRPFDHDTPALMT